MSLRVALVIEGEQSGAKKAVEDTITDVGKLETAADKASSPVKTIGAGFKDVADKSGEAKDAVQDLGDGIDVAGGKFGGFKQMALGALGGVAGMLVEAGLEWGAEAAIGAVTDYYNEVTNSAVNIEADLAAHRDLVGSVKDLWNEAAGAASSYGANSGPVLQLETSENITRLQDDLTSELGRVGGIDFVANPYRVQDGPMQDTLVALKEDLADGLADIVAWRDQVAAIANETELGSAERDLAADFIAKTKTAVELQTELQRSVDIFKALTGDADAAATAMGKAAENMTADGTAAATANPALAEHLRLLKEISLVTVTVGGEVVTGKPGTIGGSFDVGGWTGGEAGKPVGIVHGEEFVVRAGPAAANRELLEAINGGVTPPGYATGGFVGAARPPSISGGGSGSIGSTNPLAWLLGGFSDLPDLVQGAKGAVLGFFDDVDAAQKSGKQGWDAWGAAGINALDRVASQAWDMAISGIFDLVAGAITGAFGGGWGWGGNPLSLGAGGGGFLGGGATSWAGIGHSGAMIGQSSSGRLVDMAMFDNAPRHHTGTDALRPGEVPFIGMEGEEIGWPDDLARKYGGAGAVTYNYYTIDARGSTLSASQFEAILDARDRRRADQLPSVLADARYRAIGDF